MSYVAIARKYRPSTFEDIVGQEHVTRTLTNALRTGRIHHAFLFCGARGVGKTTAARALARALNCAEGPTPTPCGACPSCRALAAGTSPDLIEVDGASNNSVDDVRSLRETVAYAPSLGRFKVYLIDEVHMLSKAAFNALLKTLEEPPPHVIFIFATTEPEKIIETILSRVQRFDFKRIPAGAVVERLRQIAAAEGAELSAAALRQIAVAGEGSMRDAQSLLDKVLSAVGRGPVSDAAVSEVLGLVDRRLIHELLAGLAQGDLARCLTVVEETYGYGHELSLLTGDLLEALRHATLLRRAPSLRRFVDVSGEELAALEAATEGATAEQLARQFEALIEVHDQVAQASRPRLVLELALVRLTDLRPAAPLESLVRRLEQVERNLGGAPRRAESARPAARPPEPPPRPAEPAGRATEPPPRPAEAAPRPPEPRAEAAPRRPEGAARAPEPAPARPAEAPPPEAPPPSSAAPGSAGAEAPGGLPALRQALRGLDALRPLAQARFQLEGDLLQIFVGPGPTLGNARLAATHSSFLGLRDRHLPGVKIQVEVDPLLAQAKVVEARLQQQPGWQRVLDTLHGRLVNVHPPKPTGDDHGPQ